MVVSNLIKPSTKDVDVLESGPHNAIQAEWTDGGHKFRKHTEYYQYVKNGKSGPVESGSHYVYYVTGQEPSPTRTTPAGSRKTRVATGSSSPSRSRPRPSRPTPCTTRARQGPVAQRGGRGLGQRRAEARRSLEAVRRQQDRLRRPGQAGPVRSEGEPDRGDYPDVPWVMIPDTEEQTGDCDNAKDEAKAIVDGCVAKGATGDFTVSGSIARKGDGQSYINVMEETSTSTRPRRSWRPSRVSTLTTTVKLAPGSHSLTVVVTFLDEGRYTSRSSRTR